MRRLRSLSAALAAAALLSTTLACGKPSREPAAETKKPTPVAVAKRTAVTPKPVSDTVRRGLTWLASHQLESGGWGQGDEVSHLRRGEPSRETANVGDTSMALMAFLRAGNTARTGDYQTEVQRGIEYVLGQIEASDDTSLYVTDVRGTRVQAKIGQYADTFAALMMLNEAKGSMRDGVANARVEQAIRKVVKKVEHNQREDGTWANDGWAPVLTQALAAKGLNRVAQNGFTVSTAVLDRVEKAANGRLDARTGAFDLEGSAGIGLYGAAAAAPASDSAATKRQKADELKERASGKDQRRRAPAPQAPDMPTQAEVDRAEEEAQQAEASARKVERALIARLDDAHFIAGFGNNGGEEFLSHIMIAESLVLRGGEEWAKWDAAMTSLMAGIQNEDGSWTGHHCITGRTFCTAAALLVLLADRTPVPDVQIAG
jgi:hypothetical protein